MWHKRITKFVIASLENEYKMMEDKDAQGAFKAAWFVRFGDAVERSMAEIWQRYKELSYEKGKDVRPEAKFWNDIKNDVQAVMKGGRVSRIENAAGTGQPDVNIAYQGIEFWVELKVGGGDDDKHADIKKSQKAWHMKQWANGGISFIWIYSAQHRLIYVYEGLYAARLAARMVPVRNAVPVFFILKPTLRNYEIFWKKVQILKAQIDSSPEKRAKAFSEVIQYEHLTIGKLSN